MKRYWTYPSLVLGAVLMLSAPAFAFDHPRPAGPPPPPPPARHHSFGTSGAAPEVDPGLAVAGLGFLAGSLAVLRSRLRR